MLYADRTRNIHHRRLKTVDGMKINLLFWFGLMFWGGMAAAQPRLTNVRFKINAELKMIEINYDVFGVRLSDSIYVTAVGKKSGKLKAQSLSGDIGRNIKPGSKKTILWDVIADNVRIDEEVEISVFLALADALTIISPDSLKKKVTPLVKKEPKGKRLNGGALLMFGGGLVAGAGMYYWSTLLKTYSQESYALYQQRNWIHEDGLNLKVNDSSLQARYNSFLEQANADLSKANRQKRLGQTMLIGGILVAVADIFLVGPQLLQPRNEAIQLKLETNEWGGPSAGVTIKF